MLHGLRASFWLRIGGFVLGFSFCRSAGVEFYIGCYRVLYIEVSV